MDNSIYFIGSILIIATVFDWKTKKIPNLFNFFVLIASLFFSIYIMNVGVSKIFFHIIRAFVLAYPFYYFNVLGAGDVKLFMGIALFLPLNSWLMLIFISLFVAAPIYCCRLFYRNEFSLENFHYYRYTHFILWAYFILLALNKNGVEISL